MKRKILPIVITTLFFCVAVPIIINELYKTGKGYVTVWNGADVLSYYGSLLGAIATIVALICTINFTIKSQREERKLAIKPRLESKWQHYNKKIFSLSEDDDIIYVNFDMTGITAQDTMTSEITSMLSLFHAAENKDTSSLDETFLDLYKEGYLKKHLHLLYEIHNFGAGNAINAEFQINDCLIYPKFCIPTSTPKKIMLIVSEDVLDNETLDFNISITYTDICSLAKYVQTESFIIFKADNEFQSMQDYENKLSEPKEIR